MGEQRMKDCRMIDSINSNGHAVYEINQHVELLEARIKKLEEIIVKLANEEPEEEPHYSIEDMAEIALENRANEDRGEDR